MNIQVKTKQWGNSIGMIIPTEVVRELSISPGEEVVVNIQKSSDVLRELFGSLKFKKNTRTLLKEFRKEMEGKYI